MTAAGLAVRRAADTDADRIFAWRNDPQTRAASLSQDEVDWATHIAWLDAVLADPGQVLSIVQDASGIPMAVCRFDREPDGTVEVSINLDPAVRGRGLAAPALDAAIEDYLNGSPRTPLIAVIRENNPASVRIFERLGFRRISATGGIATFRRD